MNQAKEWLKLPKYHPSTTISYEEIRVISEFDHSHSIWHGETDSGLDFAWKGGRRCSLVRDGYRGHGGFCRIFWSLKIEEIHEFWAIFENKNLQKYRQSAGHGGVLTVTYFLPAFTVTCPSNNNSFIFSAFAFIFPVFLFHSHALMRMNSSRASRWTLLNSSGTLEKYWLNIIGFLVSASIFRKKCLKFPSISSKKWEKSLKISKNK